MYYVFTDEHGRPGFKIEGQNEIDYDTDCPISKAVYDKFFELQEQGSSLRLKDDGVVELQVVLESFITALNSFNFEDIFEEYTPEIPPEVQEEIEAEQAKVDEVNELRTQLAELQSLVSTLLPKEEKVRELPIERSTTK